jgi:hypothetical protein
VMLGFHGGHLRDWLIVFVVQSDLFVVPCTAHLFHPPIYWPPSSVYRQHHWKGTSSEFHSLTIHGQWWEQVFDTLPILQVFLLTKHVKVCNFYRFTLTVRDGI